MLRGAYTHTHTYTRGVSATFVAYYGTVMPPEVVLSDVGGNRRSKHVRICMVKGRDSADSKWIGNFQDKNGPLGRSMPSTPQARPRALRR